MLAGTVACAKAEDVNWAMQMSEIMRIIKGL
jgi:hypothetical protein